MMECFQKQQLCAHPKRLRRRSRPQRQQHFIMFLKLENATTLILILLLPVVLFIHDNVIFVDAAAVTLLQIEKPPKTTSTTTTKGPIKFQQQQQRIRTKSNNSNNNNAFPNSRILFLVQPQQQEEEQLEEIQSSDGEVVDTRPGVSKLEHSTDEIETNDEKSYKEQDGENFMTNNTSNDESAISTTNTNANDVVKLESVNVDDDIDSLSIEESTRVTEDELKMNNIQSIHQRKKLLARIDKRHTLKSIHDRDNSFGIKQQGQHHDDKARFLANGIFALNIPKRIPQYCWNICYKLVTKHPTKLVVGTTAVAIICKSILSEPVRRTVYFWKTTGPIIVHYRFTKWWLRINNVERTRRDEIYEVLHNKYNQPTYNMIVQLKGLYIKMGQILSSRPDFVPYQYVSIFSQLQDSIPQSSIEDIEQIISVSLLQNLNIDYKNVFISIDPIALGSASIGQVHRATLHPQWVTQLQLQTPYVAIKVMNPLSKQRFANDFQVFRWLCRITLPGWAGFLNTLEKQIMTEFDYRTEAQSLNEVNTNMAMSSLFSNKVCVPKPYVQLCTQHVLVMEYLHGIRLIDSIQDQIQLAFGNNYEAAKQFMTLKRSEVITGQDLGSSKLLHTSVRWYGKIQLLYYIIKCQKIIDLLVSVHGYQIFVNGCWNGDPHAGNFLLLNDGRIGLIDYGQTKRITNSERIALAKIIVAINNNNNNNNNNNSNGDVDDTTTSSSSIITRYEENVANAMKDAGFTIANDDNSMLTKYAKLFFDSDEDGLKSGCVTPQHYFARLMFTNPLTTIPDCAVFVGRASFLFRGFGHAIGSKQIKTSSRWLQHAKQALIGNS